ncbi:tRNA uracil 4-sulfurtransferase ThiI [Rheinheimera sp. 4Y26]|uniref:tRNA uracil 4-sulfurtransferase ThiI n=1 Tax=Rheinheimera sp. 4Y26 TaxID=2977811 RepID=UPI0021B0A716|nr:tRNA uracil 4-sulfurtransferase ThiI [Rheinheimera sp. 4Y26]MCT6699110.1 tRNA 4-thiouridine(8) synthase ThiI [Rheinheimera sp. 4Y26]
MIEFIVKLHPEISIKSKSVRKRQTMLLEQNLKTILLQLDPSIVVRNLYDHLTVMSPQGDEALAQKMAEQLQCIPGIVQFARMQSSEFSSLHDIFEQVLAVYRDQLHGKTFCVRVRRQGNHDFSSIEAERYIGGGLNQHIPTAQVKLKQPDVTVLVEIRKEKLIIVRRAYQGMGGFPLPSQGDVLSLISGGFDSAVASYLMIRKGLRTHYLFFNLGGAAHETGVRQMAFYLWQKYSLSHKVKFVSVDFAPVVTEILEKIDNGLMGVVLKRMMMRAATTVADSLNIKAVVTGESIGQVASQTIVNLNVIDRVTEMLILRPLVYQDKQEIIDIARAIGVEDLAKTMPEYCGVISKSPTINAVLADVNAAEARFDFSILEKVSEDAKVLDIRTVEYQAGQQVATIDTEAVLPEGAVVLDVRAPDEAERNPLQLDSHQVIELPFYKIASGFAELAKDKQYYLYCDRGVMSRLQALLLKEQGYQNVAVYKKDK